MKSTLADSFYPLNQDEWRKWLERHHESRDFIWLIIYKKGSATPNLSWSDAVDEALCFGWIDSTKRPIDAEKYMQYFGKRKPKSIWSRINKNKISQLIADGRMHENGLRTVEIAKKNGSWTILDDVEDLIIPVDLQKALDGKPGSEDYFLNLSKSIKKGLLYWVVSAKRPETREKRIAEIAFCARQGRKPVRFQ